MTNRVVLQAGRFAVSKPGWDVLTAPATGLQFSSDWGQLGLYKEGFVDANWNENGWRYFSWGKSFDRPPIVNMQLDDGTRTGGFFGYFTAKFENNLSPISGGTKYNNHEVVAIADRDNLRVRSTRQNESPGVSVPDYRIRYWVFEHNF